MKAYQLIIEKNDDGFWGQFVEFPSVFTQGDDINQVVQNAREALLLFLEETGKEPLSFEITLLMDLVHFFQVNNYINITSLAKRSGMNASLLRQYARGIKFPSMNQVMKIEQAVHDIGAELVRTELTDKRTSISN